MWENVQRNYVSFFGRCYQQIRGSWQRIYSVFFSVAARPLRFITTGMIAGLLQLALLDVYVRWGWNVLLANLVAFLLAAQVNFLLSFFFTWNDRQFERKNVYVFFSRWLTFHSAITGSAVLNQCVFVLARIVMPTLYASALGIGIAALVNFVTMNTFVFRPKKPGPVVAQTNRALDTNVDTRSNRLEADDVVCSEERYIP